VTLWTILVGAVGGALAGAALWRWLRTGAYRIGEDEPRLSLDRSWAVVPAAAAGGALAGVLADPWLAIAAWLYLVGSVSVIWIDLDVHRVPDRVLRWWAPELFVAVVLAASAGTGGWGVIVTGVLAGLAMAVLFFVLAVVGSMGLGDVKLAAVTGLMLGALGWSAVTTGVLAGFVAGAIAAVWLLIRGASRTSHLAFGPAIIVGAAAAIARAGFIS
jgi:leader peptidase (prepilin peptidase)/N-methyltransferase